MLVARQNICLGFQMLVVFGSLESKMNTFNFHQDVGLGNESISIYKKQ